MLNINWKNNSILKYYNSQKRWSYLEKLPCTKINLINSTLLVKLNLNKSYIHSSLSERKKVEKKNLSTNPIYASLDNKIKSSKIPKKTFSIFIFFYQAIKFLILIIIELLQNFW